MSFYFAKVALSFIINNTTIGGNIVIRGGVSMDEGSADQIPVVS